LSQNSWKGKNIPLNSNSTTGVSIPSGNGIRGQPRSSHSHSYSSSSTYSAAIFRSFRRRSSLLTPTIHFHNDHTIKQQVRYASKFLDRRSPKGFPGQLDNDQDFEDDKPYQYDEDDPYREYDEDEFPEEDIDQEEAMNESLEPKGTG
jgi:hypothetical protein